MYTDIYIYILYQTKKERRDRMSEFEVRYWF